VNVKSNIDSYRHFFNQNPTPSFLLCDDIIIDCNASALSLFNVEAKSVLENKSWATFCRELNSASYIIDKATASAEEFMLKILDSGEIKQHFNVLMQKSDQHETVFVNFVENKLTNNDDDDDDTHTLKLGKTIMALKCEHLFKFVSDFFDNFEVGIVIIDHDSKEIVAINELLLSRTGYREKELIDTPISRISPDLYALHLEDETPQNTNKLITKQFITRNNTSITQKIIGSFTSKLNEGKYVWFFVSSVTNTEALTSQLLKSEERLNYGQRQAKIGYWELNLVSGKLYWSDEVFNIFGLNHKQFKPSYDTFLNAVHPDDRDTVKNTYENSLITQKPYNIKYRLLMQNGVIKYVKERCDTSFDLHGKPLVSKGTVQDITLGYVSKLHLNRLATILEFSKDFIGIADINGRVTYINEPGKKMIGFTDNLESVVSFIPDLYIEPKLIEDDLLPTLKKQGRWRGELKMKHFSKPGESVLCFCEAFRFDDPNTGEVLSYACVSEDITEKRAAEERLNAYHSNLELIVNVRTEEWKKAKEDAVKANHAKSEFLSRMSHELRTPLNAVLGFGQILKSEQDPLNEIHVDFLNEILNSANHLLELINDILDLSKIENKKLELNTERFLIDKEINGCISMLGVEIKKKDISLSFDSMPATFIEADKKRFKQVLINVLSNAIKYSPSGSAINISSAVLDDHLVEIRVKDEGIGINQENLNKVFDPFVKFSNSNDFIEGVGIGLSIAKELLVAMSGDIKLVSEEGLGTTCHIQLPLFNISTPKLEEGAQQTTILYIEDNVANMKLVRRIFEKYPALNLIEAVNGRQGLLLAKENLPNLILLDLQLPDIGGQLVFNSLKDNPLTSNIPVIAVTADVIPENINDYALIGFDGYISKPFDYNELLSMVKNNLK
tara:strand:+ start:385 stop:3081 length:2697 start_codon:yes stop_codon:yes gene_type:complete